MKASALRVGCGFYIKRESNENPSGNEVLYTACSLLVTFKKSFSKLHCWRGCDLILFSCKMYGSNSTGYRERGILNVGSVGSRA